MAKTGVILILFPSLILIGCSWPVISPPGTEIAPAIATVDQFMDDLAKRAAGKFGQEDNFKVVVTQADYPVGTLMQAGRTIPINYTSCVPANVAGMNTFAPAVNVPSLFPQYTISKNLAIDIGLDNEAIEKLINFGVDVKNTSKVAFSVKAPKVQMLADSDLKSLLGRADCKASIPSTPVWLIRGYILGQRTFLLQGAKSGQVKAGIEKIGKFDVAIGGDAALNVTDDAQVGFLQIISQVMASPGNTTTPVVSAPVASQVSGKVYVQRDRLDNSGKGDVVVALLKAASFNVASAIEAVETRRMPRLPQIRYFNDGDKARAEEALISLKNQFPNATLSRVSLPAPTGQIEIWLPRAGSDS
jgi:hypothetical protein